MTENMPTLVSGEEYVLFYTGGPADGQIDRRVSRDGKWEKSVTVFIAVDGLQTGLVYRAESARTRAGQVQVTYVWDEASSDAIEDLDDRGEY